MKKFLLPILILALCAAVAEPGYAQTRKKSGASKPRTTATRTKSRAAVPSVVKGEEKTFGDELVTQQFTYKKGKSSITVDYPLSGNPELVSAIRGWIRDMLVKDYTGTLDTPDAMLKKALTGMEPGETRNDEVKVIYYADGRAVTILENGEWYGGGAHGMYYEIGATFNPSDGSQLTVSMLPPISKMRPLIEKGLAKYFDVSVYELSDVLMMGNVNDLDYPESNAYVTPEGLNVQYSAYEIAPFSAGLPKAVIPLDKELAGMLSPAVLSYFPTDQVEKACKAEEGRIYAAVEQAPQFPGGQGALSAWLAKNLSYPEAAIERGAQGRVVVKFVVEKDGSITNPAIERGVDAALDAEAIRLVEKMPKWTPGKNNGVPVRSWFTLPVGFRMTN